MRNRIPCQRDAGTRLATALRRRPFSACNKGNRRRLHAGKWACCQNTTSGILSTGIFVQGTWLMLRSIWLFFHFCWLQITVLKVSSIIIPVDSDTFWSHNWRSKAHANNEQPISLARCFCFKKLKIDYSA